MLATCRKRPEDEQARDTSGQEAEKRPWPKLLTIAEAAGALSLSVRTVRGLCAERRLRHERHGLRGGSIRIPEDALAEYRQGVTVQARTGLPVQAWRPTVKLRNLSLD